MLLARTSLCHLAARRGWTEVPCTRLEGGGGPLPPTLRTRSVPIIPSLQACDVQAAAADTPGRGSAGPLRRHPLLTAGKSPPRSDRSLSSAWATCSVATAVELAQGLKERRLRSPEEITRSQSESHSSGTGGPGGTGSQEARPGAASRGLESAEGQREAQGLSQGQPSPASGAAITPSATGGAVCRGSRGARARPSAS